MGLGYIFEWDRKKAEPNLRKHGVGFEEACTVFADPLALLMPDPDHSAGEERYILLGMSNKPSAAFGPKPTGATVKSSQESKISTDSSTDCSSWHLRSGQHRPG